MSSCYSFIENKQFQYQWVIKNFTDNFKGFSYTNRYEIFSEKFDVQTKTEKHTLNLQMKFTHESMALYLSGYNNLNLVYCLSILNKNKDRFETITVSANCLQKNSYKDQSKSLHVTTLQLLSNAFDLFPDNNLTVMGEFIIFENNTTINPVYVNKKYLSMKDNMKELLKSQNGSDIIIEVDDKQYEVHRTILMARSPVFSAMFSNNMIEKELNRVKIDDISSSIVELLIHFIYTDEIEEELNLETAIDLLKAASKYQLEGLEVLCENKLFNMLTKENAMDILLMSEKYNLTDFTESIKEFIKAHRQEIYDIMDPEYFLSHPHHTHLFLTRRDPKQCEDKENHLVL